MEFRTQVKIGKSNLGLSYTKQGLFIGSCFAEEIACRMQRLRFPVVVNPFGITYNPASLVGGLDLLNADTRFSEQDLMLNHDLWVSWRHHSSFASTDRHEALRRINQSAEQGNRALKDAKYLIITLGTAWVYEHVATGEIVNNCHKFPAADFRRSRLSVDKITALFSTPLESYLRNKQVIFTVSPIRHLKDGLPENQLSKATLLVAIHRLCEKYDNCHYFPAYEIMLDELRDYRFYEADILHPSRVAVDYIWERFSEWAMNDASLAIMQQVEKLITATEHRPFNPESTSHLKFRSEIAMQAHQIQQQYPEIILTDIIHYFES